MHINTFGGKSRDSLNGHAGERPQKAQCRSKKICSTYSGCVFVDLGIQHAKYMHLIILLSVARPAALYFYTLSIKRREFGKTFHNINCVF